MLFGWLYPERLGSTPSHEAQGAPATLQLYEGTRSARRTQGRRVAVHHGVERKAASMSPAGTEDFYGHFSSAEFSR